MKLPKTRYSALISALLVATLPFFAGCHSHHHHDHGSHSMGHSAGSHHAHIHGHHYEFTKMAPNSAAVGDTYQYHYHFTPKTDLANVEIHDKLPAGVKLINTTPASTVSGNHVVWRMDHAEAHETYGFTMNVQAESTGLMENCAQVKATPVACTAVHVGKPMLTISKEGPDTVLLGDDAHFHIRVENTGDYIANDVVVTDTIPAGLRHSSGNSEVTFDAGHIHPGDHKHFHVDLNATKRGTFCNKAMVASSNTGSAKDQACVNVVMPQLEITKVGDARRFIGENASYDIAVTNSGDYPLKDVTVTDRYPNPLSLAKAPGAMTSSNEASWQVETLMPGQTERFRLMLNSMVPGTFTNEVMARSGKFSDRAEFKTTWVGVSGIELEATDTNDPIRIGNRTTYNIRVLNEGSAPDSNVTVTVMLPEEVNAVMADGPVPHKLTQKRVNFSPIPTLNPGQTVNFSVTVVAVEAGDAFMEVLVDTDDLDEELSERESTTVF